MGKVIINETTGEVLSQIKRTKNIERMLEKKTVVDHISIHDQLRCFMEKYDLKRAEIIEAAGIDRVFGYEIFRGKRIPSRDVLLKLLICMNATLQEIQSTLKVAGLAELYSKSVRDAIILHGIINNSGLRVINEKLFKLNERVL